MPNETCPTGSSSIAGLEFEFAAAGTPTRPSTTARCSSPTTRATASGSCRRARTASPAPGQIRTFVAAAANPVDLEIGPGGDLFYVDFDGGTIRRISYAGANQPPDGRRHGDTRPTGAAPLTVTFDGTRLERPGRGDTLTYAWDLDGDGAYDDSTASAADAHLHRAAAPTPLR